MPEQGKQKPKHTSFLIDFLHYCASSIQIKLYLWLISAMLFIQHFLPKKCSQKNDKDKKKLT